MRFFAQCGFSHGTAPDEKLYVYWEVADLGEVRTFDPANYLSGVAFSRASLSRGDGPKQIWLMSESTGADGRVLVLESSSPPDMRNGIEVLVGGLLRGGETRPYEEGTCAMVVSPNADEFFDRMIAEAGATQ